ncbi:unnamed protein product [Vitrella brassicaformis CCMP3155]|uniref:Cyclin-dependent kinases regulatory subunit n=1 Tax=Vitrella brassicaformis (strain CCMP3155) TaxID=1169540 RepID=A0A0G4EJC9_VITBC|nr:unnamed protein product [Vitrella brassicaformis CCMP3155]|eukprot:CEL96612.1 unnamed protein product [Vitrella brassicaformis CCMP3155]
MYSNGLFLHGCSEVREYSVIGWAVYGPRMQSADGEWRTVELSNQAFHQYEEIKGHLPEVGGREQGQIFTMPESYWRYKLGLHMSSGWLHMGNPLKEPYMMMFHLPRAASQTEPVAADPVQHVTQQANSKVQQAGSNKDSKNEDKKHVKKKAPRHPEAAPASVPATHSHTTTHTSIQVHPVDRDTETDVVCGVPILSA